MAPVPESGEEEGGVGIQFSPLFPVGVLTPGHHHVSPLVFPRAAQPHYQPWGAVAVGPHLRTPAAHDAPSGFRTQVLCASKIRKVMLGFGGVAGKVRPHRTGIRLYLGY